MKALLTAAAILWASVASAQVADFYEVAGESSDGKPYIGILTTEKAENGTYSFQWELEKGDRAVGIAIVDGPVFSVIFQTEGGQIGFALYKKVGEEWQGQWSGPGAPGIYGEVLRPSKKTLEKLRQELKAMSGPRVRS
jgi:hypothetical protein